MRARKRMRRRVRAYLILRRRGVEHASAVRWLDGVGL